MSDSSPLKKILQHYKNLYAGISEDSRALLPLKGKWFETICLYFLKHDPIYKNKFSSVWLWSDWPGRNNRPDTGIDIVAQIRDSDKFCAVQCKFYEDNHRITKDDINTFLAASGQENFIERIIISISGDYNKNALDTLDNQQIKCSSLTIDRLENSPIDWAKFDADNLENFSYKAKRILREDQQDALNKVIEGFQNHDRGKMIMACGTGKTFVSLKIAEKLAGKGKKILYLVPSIALLNQTLLAWNEDIDINLKATFFAVCSDSTVGKRDKDNEDMKIFDLAYPATTKASDLISSWQNIKDSRKQESMTVIFSTYQSLQVINEIQNMGFPDFDLIICDEAHRTSGVTLKNDDDDSIFVKVHDNNFIRSSKRLYMTATPKVYSESASKKAKENDAVIYSMDDSNLFGENFYTLPFSHAIQEKLLTDYRVMILAIDQRALSEPILKLIADRKITADDATKMFGCWRGLSKQFISSDFEAKNFDPLPMKTAVAFTSKIEYSKNFQESFADIIDAFKINYNISGGVNCSVDHVDGTMNMHDRENKLSWLKENQNDNSCRILSNARCLSEGVDVPALDAILFLNPKKSKVDIVQAVGRVMRKSPDKKLGYVILPVVVPPGVTPEDALNTDKNYNVIWDVLQALRSHDDKFQVEINSLKYDGLASKIITGVIGRPDKDNDSRDSDIQLKLPFSPEDWQKAVYAQIVEKCGDREYDSKWAKNMSEIAQTLKARINSLLNTDNEFAQEIFTRYLQGLRENINDSITPDDAVDMLSQHFVTKPIFDACFEKFSELDPVSKTSEAALNFLEQAGLEIERKSLEKFYRSQTEKLSLLQTDEGRQQRIKDLYENFFRVAFPKTSQSLGIVYTPNEVVDFILRSADWALKHELNISEGLSAHNVNILDPFTGTGTFIVRLIQLGLIPPDRLAHKYKKELHANEILMLAYYIAAVNIEMAYHSAKPDEIFEPFPGVVLTDTFNENNGKQITFIFDELSRRAIKQHDSPITVIIGNPPYSVGQKSANDNNQNLPYKELDERITETYAALSNATNKNSLYDSYIRAIRWASDRIENDGIICYVTNGSFIDSNSADGLRKSLYDEFQRIYIFNLRGNQYTAGELSRKEGGKIFGSGSRLPVAITLFVKDSARKGEDCKIFYRDIGDYLSRSEKLNEIERSKSFGEMLDGMIEITPNNNGDWINKRNEIFDTFLRLGNKKESQEFAIFEERYSGGLKTNRDSWCYNFSREALKYNISSMIDTYNHEREKWHAEKNHGVDIKKFVTMDDKKISWSDGLFSKLKRNIKLEFSENLITPSLYRPFTKHFLYYYANLNDRVCRIPSIFPTAESKNLVICVTGIGSKKNFSVLMADCVPDVQLMFNGQCFPLYWYEESAAQKLLFDESPEHKKRDAISDKALSRFRTHYNDNGLTKEDIFYYIYGVLSSPEYRERFGVDVFKSLARVPLVKNFYEFSEAGRKLEDLHVNYERMKIDEPLTGENLRVEKMRIITRDGEKCIRYNDDITIKNIPAESWDYIVNGKSALEWIVERYQDSTDKDSGLRNNCNAWADEHNDPRYILDLILRVMKVSAESVRIIKNLPELGIN